MLPKNAADQTHAIPENHHAIGEDLDRAVVVLATEFPPGFNTGEHWHVRSQLVYASAGVMKVTAEEGTWVVPQQRAVWIPALMRHEVRSTGPVSMRSLYILPSCVPGLPTRCSVVAVSPMLRELIATAAALPERYELGGRDERVMQLILDEVQASPVEPLHLPESEEPRVRQVTASLKLDPSDSRTLEDWGHAVGASSRTLARLFLSETGMTFREWQRQARLLESLVRLAEGQPVTTVALEVGYESASAYISMFKQALGVTPGQYFGSRPEGPSTGSG